VIVADTNLVAYLLIQGERTEAARRVWARDPDWRLPTLWRSEFLSVLTVSARSGVITTEQAYEAWNIATVMFADSEDEPAGEEVLAVAHRLGISAYDAQFVAVAEKREAVLVTGDRRLRQACGEGAVAIEEFGSQEFLEDPTTR